MVSLVTLCLTGKIFTILVREDRTIVKTWVASTIGHHTFHTRWPKNAIQELKYVYDAGIKKSADQSDKSVASTQLLLEHSPMLAELQQPGRLRG